MPARLKVAWPNVAPVLVLCGLVALAASASCSKKRASGASTAPSATTAAKQGHPLPGDPDCYSTTGAKACPESKAADGGTSLPRPGALCALPPCVPCGSDKAPTFVDGEGKAKAGWCICVARSDDSGVGTYSCFPTAEWRANHPGGS